MSSNIFTRFSFFMKLSVMDNFREIWERFFLSIRCASFRGYVLQREGKRLSQTDKIKRVYFLDHNSALEGFAGDGSKIEELLAKWFFDIYNKKILCLRLDDYGFPESDCHLLIKKDGIYNNGIAFWFSFVDFKSESQGVTGLTLTPSYYLCLYSYFLHSQ